jgi:hypothetical protein
MHEADGEIIDDRERGGEPKGLANGRAGAWHRVRRGWRSVHRHGGLIFAELSHALGAAPMLWVTISWNLPTN